MTRVRVAAQLLVETALVVCGVVVVAALWSVAAGPMGSQRTVLGGIAVQQLTIAGVTVALARHFGLGRLAIWGGAPPPRWVGAAVLGAPGAALCLGPLLDRWAAAIDADPPAWYGSALDVHHPEGLVLVLLVIVALAPVAEELWFRGYLLGRLPGAAGVALQAALFAAWHIDLYGLPAYLLLGAVLGVARLRSGGIAAGVLFHALYNAVGVLEHTLGGLPVGPGWVRLALGGALLAGAVGLAVGRPAERSLRRAGVGD